MIFSNWPRIYIWIVNYLKIKVAFERFELLPVGQT